MSKSVKQLWLDLEDTIITPVVEGWWKTEIINLDKILRVIRVFEPDVINVFSFAVWNQEQLRLFNEGTRWLVERALGRPIDLIPTVDDDILPAACKIMGISPQLVDFSEMSAFWGKQDAFKHFIRARFSNLAEHDTKLDVILLDDMVFHEEFNWPKLGIRGRIINIDEVTNDSEI